MAAQHHDQRDGISIEDRYATRGRSGKRWLARVRDTRLRRYKSKSFAELDAAKAWARHMRARFELAESSAGKWPLETLISDCANQMRRDGKNTAYVTAFERHGGLFRSVGCRDLADTALHDKIRLYLNLPTHERHRRGRADGIAASSTLIIRYNYIRSLVTYAIRYCGLRHDPLMGFVISAHVRRSTITRTSNQETYTLDEVRSVLALNDASDPAWVAFVLSVFTGLRAFELRALRWDAIDWSVHTLLVARGKGAKVRFVPLHDQLYDFLRRLGGPDIISPHLGNVIEIPNHRLQVSHLRPLLERAGVKWDRGINEITGLPRRLTWHACRRTCAAASLAAGVDSLEIQRSLGHEEMEMTGEYAGAFTRWKAVVQAEAWPRGRLCLFAAAVSTAVGSAGVIR